MPAIAVENLVKTYNYYQKEPGLRGSIRGLWHREILERRAVDGISFQIDAGEIVGFLGPNGAGKTTTLKVLCGLLYPTSGAVSVLGAVPSRRKPEFLRRIALVMGQRNMLSWDVPAWDSLLLQRDMYEIPNAEFEKTVTGLGKLLEISQLFRVQVRKLSLGERMKMELLAALVHRPDVLFLDEPTIGLDVVSQLRVRDFLRQLNAERGTTILLTSHYMADIEALCPRVFVIDRGQIGYDGSLSDLVHRVAPHKLVTASYSQPVDARRLFAMLPEGTLNHADLGPAQVPPLALTDSPTSKIELSVARENVGLVVQGLLSLGPIADLGVEEAPVDDIIRQVFLEAASQENAR
ncbi:MAG TPA: ATP-binding cassette domain-containing protein [Chloroflexota bacterium]|nr:ATP-binding cassette domain-containing protein [Chloroflexota bacterium]